MEGEGEGEEGGEQNCNLRTPINIFCLSLPEGATRVGEMIHEVDMGIGEINLDEIETHPNPNPNPKSVLAEKTKQAKKARVWKHIRTSYAKRTVAMSHKIWDPGERRRKQAAGEHITPFYKSSRKGRHINPDTWTQTPPSRPTSEIAIRSYMSMTYELKTYISAGLKKQAWKDAFKIYSRLAIICISGDTFDKHLYFRKRQLLFIKDVKWGDLFSLDGAGEPRRVNVVYMLMSPFVRKAYIGSTQIPRERFQRHIRQALVPQRRRLDRTKPIMQKLYNFMQSTGATNWLMIPIAIFRDFPATKKYRPLLFEMEKEFISILKPALNTIKMKFIPASRTVLTDKLGASRRKKPSARLRRRTRERRQWHIDNGTVDEHTTSLKVSHSELPPALKFTLIKPFENHVITQTTYRLREALAAAMWGKTHMQIVWENGRCEITKWEYIRVHFGSSKVVFGGKVINLLQMIPKIRTTRKGMFGIKEIVNSSKPNLGALQFLRLLVMERAGWNYVTHKLLDYSFNDLLFLRTISHRLPRNLSKLADEALELVLAYRFDYVYRSELTLKLTYSENIEREHMLNMIKRMVKNAEIPGPLKLKLLDRSHIKIVHLKAKSIRRQTCNYKLKICNNYDPKQPPACACRQSGLLNMILGPAAYREITFPGEDGETTESHVAFKTIDFKRFLDEKIDVISSHYRFGQEVPDLKEMAKYLAMSSSNIPAPDFQHDVENLTSMMIELTATLVKMKRDRSYPLLNVNQSNRAWFDVQYSKDEPIIFIQKKQLQCIWDQYQNRHMGSVGNFLLFFQKLTITFDVGERAYADRNIIPRDLAIFAFKHLRIDTEHYTTHLHSHMFANHFTTSSPAWAVEGIPNFTMVQWDTNSICLALGSRHARQALEMAVLSQQRPNLDEDGRVPAHLLIIPKFVLFTENFIGLNCVHALRVFPVRTFKPESPFQKCSAKNINSEASRNEVDLAMVVVTDNHKWLGNAIKKLPLIDKIFQKLYGRPPTQWERPEHLRQLDFMHAKFEKFPSAEARLSAYKQLKGISTYPELVYPGVDSISPLFLRYNLEQLGISEPGVWVAGLESLVKHGPVDTDKYLSQSVVDNIKRTFGHLVISELDKNTGASLICCPVYYFQKLRMAYTLDPHYEHVQLDKTLIFEHWKDEWAEIAPRTDEKKKRLKMPLWKDAGVPTAYILFKDKDISRHRPITTYFNHPLRKLLAAAHAAMTFIMDKVNEKVRGHFTFNVGKPSALPDLVKRTNRKIEALRDGGRNDVDIKFYMGDIKQMYTELLHSEIEAAVTWILEIFRDRFGDTILVKRRLSKEASQRQYNVVLGKSHVSADTYMQIDLEQLEKIIRFDLNNTFFRVGIEYYRQIKGIPMGSNLSPVLAYLICEYYERRVPRRIPTQHLQNIEGARYMDDLLLIYFYVKGDLVSKNLYSSYIKMITDTSLPDPIYHKDLKIKPEVDARGAPCLGTLLFLDDEARTIKIRYLNKNEVPLLSEEPHQTTLRLQHVKSFSSEVQKMGTLMGEVTRIDRLTLGTSETLEQFDLLGKEIALLGYPEDTMSKVYRKKFVKTNAQIWKMAFHRNPRRPL